MIHISHPISFEYQIVPETLFKLYTSYGEESYEEVLSQLAISSLKDISINYRSDDFYLRRAEIETAMRTKIQTRK